MVEWRWRREWGGAMVEVVEVVEVVEASEC